MKSALVTGANGFTGRYVVRALAARGCEVHALVHRSAPPPEGAAQSHVCDIADSDAVAHVLEEVRPDYVVHLAAIAFVAHGNVEEMYRTNILGTRALLEALLRREPPEAVVLASSANIYGNACSGVIDESIRPAPANDYGVTKVTTEYLAGVHAGRLPLIITRPFNYTGVGQSANYIIPKIVDHVRRREPKIELGNLDVERDFSDVRAVAEIYVRLLEAPEAVGGVFNVCSGRAVSLRRMLNIITGLADHEMTIEVNPAFVRANEVRLLTGSRAKLESVIGPVDMPPIEETLRWMLEA